MSTEVQTWVYSIKQFNDINPCPWYLSELAYETHSYKFTSYSFRKTKDYIILAKIKTANQIIEVFLLPTAWKGDLYWMKNMNGEPEIYNYPPNLSRYCIQHSHRSCEYPR